MGPGKLGSAAAIDAGVLRGDIRKKFEGGIDMFHIKRSFNVDEASDTQGRTTSQSAKVDGDTFRSALTLQIAEFADEKLALFMEEKSTPIQVQPPAQDESLERLQEAYDTHQQMTRRLRTCACKHTRPKLEMQ